MIHVFSADIIWGGSMGFDSWERNPIRYIFEKKYNVI